MRFTFRFLSAILILMSLFTYAWAGEETVDATADKAQPKQRFFKISKKTTYLEEPLTNDGFVNYVKAIEDEYGKGATPENNFAVVYLQTVGPAEIESLLRDRVFEKLGIEPLPEEGDYYVNLGAMRKRQIERNPNNERDIYDQQGRATEGPWSAQESPELAEWLQVNRQHLDRLAAGTKRERFFLPVPMADEENPPPVVSILLPTLQGMCDVARGLQARAMLRLNSGDIEGAWSDLLACHRLARLAAQDPTFIGALVGIAIDSMAFQSDAHLAQHRDLTARQAFRIRQEFRKFPDRRPMVETIDRTERFMLLDCVALIARGNLDALDLTIDNPVGKVIVKVFTRILVDWDTVLAMGNGWYDRLVDAAKQPTFAKRKLAFAELDEQMKKMRDEVENPLKFAKSFFAYRSPRKTMGRKVGGIIVVLLTPAMETAKEAENRWTMRLRLFDVSFALAGYRAENGRYPAELEALTPKYLGKLPQDLYNDAKLQYRATDKDYLLYSVGSNVQDDKGQTFGSRPPGDDIVISTHPPQSKEADE